MSELTAKENIKTADTVKRITATAVMEIGRAHV